MKNYTLLTTLLITNSIALGMEQTTKSVTTTQYTLTDLTNAIAAKNPTLVATIVQGLSNEESSQLTPQITFAQHLSDGINAELTTLDLKWYQELLLGAGLLGFGGYELCTTIWSLYYSNTPQSTSNTTQPTTTQSGTSIFNGLISSSNFPLALWSIFGGGVIIKRGYNDKNTVKAANISTIQTLLANAKNNTSGTTPNTQTTTSTTNTKSGSDKVEV